jgi:hypothetical protein
MAVYVANAPGDDYDSTVPDGYESWIDYWNKSCGKQAGWCRNCKVETKDLNGGHVELCLRHNDGKWYRHKEKGIFITPLCTGCNNPNNNDLFSVDESDLIEVP